MKTHVIHRACAPRIVRESNQLIRQLCGLGAGITGEQGLFGRARYSFEAVAIAEQLKEAANTLAKVAKSYVQDAAQRPSGVTSSFRAKSFGVAGLHLTHVTAGVIALLVVGTRYKPALSASEQNW
jgi:hypothetical protein